MSETRRSFIKKGLFVGASLCIPISWISAFDTNDSRPPFDMADLLGKSNPKLYGKDYKLRKEAYDAFLQLKKAAKKEGFNPQILSSYRNYSHQLRIWDRKYTKYTTQQGLSPKKAINKIILYSTIPGTSRHHWGTDFDIIDGSKGVAKNPLNEKHFNKGGVYHSFKKWMNENSESFGFYEVYTKNPTRKGFNYEPWHFSYLPLACEMLRSYMDTNAIDTLRNSEIQGSAHFDDAFIHKYYTENILDINPELIP